MFNFRRPVVDRSQFIRIIAVSPLGTATIIHGHPVVPLPPTGRVICVPPNGRHAEVVETFA